MALGLIDTSRAPSDGRVLHLRLTANGAIAMRQHSVLEPARAEVLLRRLAPMDRRAALKGLELLARAAREMNGRARHG